MAESGAEVILRLLVDNKAFKEGLANSLQLVKITSTQIKDLTQFRIPGPDIKALDLALERGEARVRDFIGAEKELPAVTKPASDGLGDLGKKHDEHSGKVQSGEKAVRGFFREQRLQDRVMGETRNSIVSLTGSMLPFIAGSHASGGATKYLGESLAVGMEQANAMEFALFGLGQVGGKLPGVLGSVATGAASMAGPIAAAVGVGALLIQFLRTSNEEAERAATEGLKDFQSALDRLSRPQLLRLSEEVRIGLEAVNKEIAGFHFDSLNKTVDMHADIATTAGAMEFLNEKDRERLTLLEADKTILDEILKKVEKQSKEVDALVRAQRLGEDSLLRIGSELQKQDILARRLKQEIDSRVDAEKKTALTVEEIRAKTDQLAKVEAERAHNLKSTLDMQKEYASNVDTLYQLGKASGQLLVGSLENLRQRQIAQGDLNGARQTELKIQQAIQQAWTDEVTIAETKKKLGLATTADVIKALDAQRAVLTNEKDQLAVDEKKYALRQADLQLETQQAEKSFQRGIISADQLVRQYQLQLINTKEPEKRAEIEQKIIDAQATELDQLRQMRAEREAFNQKIFEYTQTGIQSEFDSRRASEQHRFEAEKRNITDKYALVGVFEDGQVHLSEEGEKLLFELRSSNIRVLAQLGIDEDRARRDLQSAIDSESLDAQIRGINERYDADERLARQLYSDKNQLDVILAGLRKARDREVASAELGNVQRTLGAAHSIVGNIVGIARGLQEPAEGFLNNFLKALEVAQAIVAVVTTLKAIGSFFGLAQGGVIPTSNIRYAASGTQIPGGSFVVKKSAADQNKPLLQALGAREVTGGTPGKDSVAAQTEGGGIVMMMPGEMIVEPQYAPLARAINEGRLRMLAGGGSATPNYMTDLIRVVKQYVDVNPTFSSVPANIVRDLQLQQAGGVSREEFAALIDEVRRTNQKLDQLTGETRDIPDRINLNLPEQIELKAEGRDIRAVIRRDQLSDQ